MTSSSAVISVAGLTKTYSEGWVRRRKQEVLKGITLDVGQGEIFGLLGPNGAGKTTFIKILLGIVRKSGGVATLLGEPAGSRRSRRLVGYLPENLRIARHHSALSALDYYGQLNGLAPRLVADRRDHLLRTVGLADRSKDSVAKYSKGMLQRLGLAQALLHDPQLVILDEPTDGLDPVGRSHVRTILTQLKQEGRTVFVNSHILQEVELVCDRVAILDRGSLRYVGPVQDVSLSGQNPTEVLVTFELTGDEGVIRRTLADRRIDAWDPLPGSPPVTRVSTHAADQREIDSLIDRLRGAGVSLVGLSRRRMSLEQAFLTLVEGIERKTSNNEPIDAQVVGP